MRPLPAKRANRAMEASIIRTLLETTNERRRKRASQCRWRAWSRSIDPVGLVLADIEAADGQEFGVGLPAIGAVQPGLPAPQPLQEPLQGSAIATAALPVNQAARSTIPSLPDPELVRLFFR